MDSSHRMVFTGTYRIGIKIVDMKRYFIFLFLMMLCSGTALLAQPKFKAIVLTERGGHHESFVVAGLDWLKEYAKQEDFEFIVINKPDTITKEFLKDYKLFIQLNFPPYMWSDESKAAFRELHRQWQRRMDRFPPRFVTG